jgi:hypothetical protein
VRIAATPQREDASMDLYDPTAGNSAAGARRQNVHDTIRDWSYQAAHKVAADDHYERLIAEAAQPRLPAVNGVAGGWSPFFAGTRQRVGAVLIAIGARLQGMSPTVQTAAAPDGSGAAS